MDPFGSFFLFEIVFSLMFTLIPLIIFVTIILTIVRTAKRAKKSFDNVANSVWGTNDISEIVNKNDTEMRETPKSVSAMTSVYLPILCADFPDLHWDEFRNSALVSLKKQLSHIYDTFKVHRTELYRYTKSRGTCTVVFQSSVEYIVDGLKNQTRYNTYMVYVQDGEAAGDENAYSTTCPNCGAPITDLGSMQCEYCDSAITPVNTKVWKFLKAEEV